MYTNIPNLHIYTYTHMHTHKYLTYVKISDADFLL